MARTPAPLRALGAVLRALALLALLAALVAGVPYLLLEVGHQPTEVSGGMNLLTQQDDGSLFLVAVTCIGWAAWAAFALSVLVETAAVLRRRSAPRIKGLGGMQSLASFLIGGIVLLAPTAASAATTAPAVAAVHTMGANTTSAQAKATVQADEDTWPRHTVSSASELPWDLAQDYLGDGKRWKDIAALNPDIPQLASGDQYLPKGTVIKLPADARPIAAAASSAPDKTTDTQPATTAQAGPAGAEHDKPTTEHTAAPKSITVRAGDSLWSIADEQGNPTDWPAIFAANKGAATPDGGRFTNPNLIFPGQELNLPQNGEQTPAPPRTDTRPDKPGQDDGAAARPSQSPRASDGEAGTPQQEATTTPSASSSAVPDQDADAGTPPQAAPSTAPAEAESQTPSAPRTSAPDGNGPSATQSPRSAQEPVRDEESGPSVTIVALGTGAFVAAGVILMLRRRRTVQQRRRRAGRRIAMPGGRAAATEHSLRCLDATAEVDFLDAALRTLAHHCTEQERPLPALAAVQLGAEGVQLHLAVTDDGNEPPAPLAPFTAMEGAPQMWWCPADTDDLADTTVLGQMDAPYPALVALGDDTREALLLIDLERFGALHLTGAARLPVLRALGTSLAVSPLSQDLEIAVAGEDSAPGLSLIDSCVTPYTTLAEATNVVRAHHDRQHSALSGSDSIDLGAARAADTVEELWPMIVLADLDSCPDPQAAENLAQVLQQEPRTATAIITSGHQPTEAAAVWVLDTDDDTHPVPGTALHCRLVAFSDEEYADVIESALTSSSETDIEAARPSPGPTPAAKDGPAPAATDPAPAPAGRTDSLFARLTDLEGGSPAVHPQRTSVPTAADHEPDTGTEAGPLTKPTDPADPQEDASSPSRIVLPATTPVARVNSRLPEPASPPATEALPPPEATGADNSREEPAGQETAAGPVVRVLGPVDVTGAHGHIDSNRRTVATELVSWLALRTDGATRHELNEVIAPGGGRVENNTRNARIREVRRWLGDDNYYPKVNDQPDRKHRLAGVTCDWHQFQNLTHQAAGTDSNEARTLLRQALELVRGRPFTGIPPRRYAWAQTLTQDMISAVVDVADDLAALCLEAGDAQDALWAAGRGLDSGREREVLWRHRFEALARLGAHDDLETAIRQLEQYLLDAGLTMEPETEETICRLDAVRR
ncbi:LysM peptidoglycan-binding domain-containing protein [Streptomyces sp. NPDC059651]|uniref:LysM peptidoglycan-binding domain-containing protein n=1 Tax=Streptomyces sp. NPDC059651 TaxID=3346897 RepID=UPI0036A93142